MITAIVTFGAFTPRVYSKKLYSVDIPLVIGNWYGREIDIDERTYELLETRDTIMREYTNAAGDKVILVVVYSRENLRVVHAPDICLPGGGASIYEKTTEVVNLADKLDQNAIFNNYIVGKGNDKQTVFFIYKCGSQITPNPLKMQFDFYINKALRRHHSAALIRISTYAVNGDLASATGKAKQFAKASMPVLLKYLP
jgi:EpsI family protein